MSKRIIIGLALMFFAAASTTATPYSELKARLVGTSYYLDLHDGGTQPTLLVFAAINEDDGTFRASLRHPDASTVEVTGKFTLVRDLALPGTVWRVPQHYRMDLERIHHTYWWVSSTTTIELIPIRGRC